MSNRAVNLFDVEQAKALSQQLSRRDPPRRRGDENRAPFPYLRLQRAAGVEKVEVPATPPKVAPRELEPLAHAEGWEPLIKWSIAQVGAESGFVVDAQGFVIATAGNVAHDGFEGMGAELCYAMEQLARVDGSAGSLLWVDLEFERRRIVCLRVAIDETEPVILGFVGTSPGYIEVRSQLEHIVLDAMEAFSS